MSRIREQRQVAEKSTAAMQSQLEQLAGERVKVEAAAARRVQAKFENRVAQVRGREAVHVWERVSCLCGRVVPAGVSRCNAATTWVGVVFVVCREMRRIMLFGVVWCGVSWNVLCGVVWCGVVWCGVSWNVVLCCVVWCARPRLSLTRWRPRQRSVRRRLSV